MKTKFQTLVFLVLFLLITTSHHGFAQMMTLTELPNNNFCSIDAAIMNNDSVCQIVWSNPWSWYYDDGSYDDYVIWAFAGGEFVVKFELEPGPLLLIGAEINVGDGSFPTGVSFLGTEFLLVAYDNDGDEGLPGTLLDSAIITVDNYNWVSCKGLDVNIDDGVFYIGMRQLLSLPESVAPMTFDTELPTMNYSYLKSPDMEEWQLSPQQDFMVRALTCVNNKQPGYQAKDDYVGIVVSRISDFDPTIGETPDDGVLTVIDSILGYPTYYSDTSFIHLPQGYYAYGLKKYNSPDSTFSDWNYSNSVLSTVGIFDNEFTEEDMFVYPNPAHKMIYLKVKAGNNRMIKVVDITGFTIFSSNIPNSGKMSMDVSGWSKGLYLFTLFNRNGIHSLNKVIVK